MSFLSYLFYPNPPSATYSSPKALTLLIVCGLMILASFAIKHWRKRQGNPVTRKLSRSWTSALRWFGGFGLFLVVCRVEGISYVSMPFWWLVWLGALIAYVVLQVRLFRARHYEVLPKEQVEDPRDKYLPKKKKKS